MRPQRPEGLHLAPKARVTVSTLPRSASFPSLSLPINSGGRHFSDQQFSLFLFAYIYFFCLVFVCFHSYRSTCITVPYHSTNRRSTHTRTHAHARIIALRNGLTRQNPKMRACAARLAPPPRNLLTSTPRTGLASRTHRQRAIAARLLQTSSHAGRRIESQPIGATQPARIAFPAVFAAGQRRRASVATSVENGVFREEPVTLTGF